MLTLGADGAVDPIQNLIGAGGIVGIFFVLALMGFIWLKPAVDREFEKAVRQQALIDTLLAVYHHEVLPTLGDYERRLSPLLVRVEALLREVEWLLERRQAEWREGGGSGSVGDFRRRGNAGGPGSGFDQGPGPGDHPAPTSGTGRTGERLPPGEG